LDKKTYDEFIHSGLVHIIVVSWWNMMFFMIFLSLVLFFIPFYPRLVIIWIFLVIYALSCWADSSVIRALIMWILWLIALFFGQMVSTQRLLWLAFMIMLLYNPYFLVYDLWFILSFLAILWILTFNKFQFKIWNDQYLPWILAYKTTFKEFKKAISSRKDNLKYQIIVSSMKFWNNYMLPTFWASLFTAPAILFFTKQVNILAFWASLAVIMLVPIIMFVNFIALVMISLNIPGYDLLVQANKPLLDWVFFMSSVFSHNFSYFIKI
jgi:predicted membrane metal-binding protein